MTAAAAAIDSNDYYVQNSKIIQANRAYTVAALDNLGFETVPSVANFLFTRCPRIPGGVLYEKLKAKGVLVRHWTRPEIADYLRITIGSREQMDVLIEKIGEILREE